MFLVGGGGREREGGREGGKKDYGRHICVRTRTLLCLYCKCMKFSWDRYCCHVCHLKVEAQSKNKSCVQANTHAQLYTTRLIKPLSADCVKDVVPWYTSGYIPYNNRLTWKSGQEERGTVR